MEFFGKPLIEKYRKVNWMATAFCYQYQLLHAHDPDGDVAFEDDLNNDLFDRSAAGSAPYSAKVSSSTTSRTA